VRKYYFLTSEKYYFLTSDLIAIFANYCLIFLIERIPLSFQSCRNLLRGFGRGRVSKVSIARGESLSSFRVKISYLLRWRSWHTYTHRLCLSAAVAKTNFLRYLFLRISLHGEL
jgi:hypothetical protein